MTVAEKIIILRKNKHWNQTELGARIGVSRITVGSYESGKVVPKPDMLARIAEVCEADPDCFADCSVRGKEPPKKTEYDRNNITLAHFVAERLEVLFNDPSIPQKEKDKAFTQIMRSYLAGKKND